MDSILVLILNWNTVSIWIKNKTLRNILNHTQWFYSLILVSKILLYSLKCDILIIIIKMIILQQTDFLMSLPITTYLPRRKLAKNNKTLVFKMCINLYMLISDF